MRARVMEWLESEGIEAIIDSLRHCRALSGDHVPLLPGNVHSADAHFTLPVRRRQCRSRPHDRHPWRGGAPHPVNLLRRGAAGQVRRRSPGRVTEAPSTSCL